jgi:hypothetical protein
MSGMAKKLTVKVTPEERSRVLRSLLRGSSVRVKATDGQRRAVEASRRRTEDTAHAG